MQFDAVSCLSFIGKSLLAVAACWLQSANAQTLDLPLPKLYIQTPELVDGSELNLTEARRGPNCSFPADNRLLVKPMPCGWATVQYQIVSSHTEDLLVDIAFGGGRIHAAQICQTRSKNGPDLKGKDSCSDQDRYRQRLADVLLEAGGTLNVSVRMRSFDDMAFSNHPRNASLYVSGARNALLYRNEVLAKHRLTVRNTPFEWRAQRYGNRVFVKGTMIAGSSCGEGFLKPVRQSPSAQERSPRRRGLDPDTPALVFSTGIELPDLPTGEQRGCLTMEVKHNVKRSVIYPDSKHGEWVVVEHTSGRRIKLLIE